MRHGRIVIIVALGVLGLFAGTAHGQEATLDEQIDRAIERGVEHLWTWQQDTGLFSGLDPQNIPEDARYPGDRTVLAMAALAYAGEDPKKSDDMMRGLKAMIELPLEKTYTAGLRLITLAELYRRADDPRFRLQLRRAMQTDVAFLVRTQGDFGGWHYGPRSASRPKWDFSNTQLAVLGLWEAVQSGVEVPPHVFTRVRDLYLELQLDDGGWHYSKGFNTGKSYGSMTAAAVASLFICRDALNPAQGCPCRGGRSTVRRDPKLQQAILDGNAWLGKYFRADTNPRHGSRWTYYWLYAVERVGMKTGLKYFGSHDWYREGVENILRKQNRDGGWGRYYDTAFAVLFLIKGRGPILMNKVMYDGPWDLHPNDAANLAEFVGRIKEQRINWQVVNLDVPVEDLHDAPILYITAEEPLDLSDEHKEKLRRYVSTGGTILAEASCGNREAEGWWRRTIVELWPEWELKRIGREHPLWSADLKIGPRIPLIYGLNDGLRTVLVFSPDDLSCQWHTQSWRKDADLFNLGNNLYAYATDRGKLRSRLAGRDIGPGRKYADQEPRWDGQPAKIEVARLQHGAMWHVSRHYEPWKVLGEELRESARLDVDVLDAVEPGQAVPAEVDLLYVSGRGDLSLPEETVEVVKRHVDDGGLMLVEAVVGDKPFAASAREQIRRMGYSFKAIGEDHPLLSGAFGDAGAGYRIERVDYTFALRVDRVGHPLPELFGIYDGQRLVGVFSPFDMLYAQTGSKAFDSRGYAPADARALATNLAMFVARQRAAAGDEAADQDEADTTEKASRPTHAMPDVR